MFTSQLLYYLVAPRDWVPEWNGDIPQAGAEGLPRLPFFLRRYLAIKIPER